MFVIVSRLLVPKGFQGMAIFPFVLLRDRKVFDFKVLVNHEKIHIRQQWEMLVILFFVWYGLEFLYRWVKLRDRRMAYRNISFEREAYTNEKDLDYLRSRSFWGFTKYLQ